MSHPVLDELGVSVDDLYIVKSRKNLNWLDQLVFVQNRTQYTLLSEIYENNLDITQVPITIALSPGETDSIDLDSEEVIIKVFNEDKTKSFTSVPIKQREILIVTDEMLT
jgi:hypothetical protein